MDHLKLSFLVFGLVLVGLELGMVFFFGDWRYKSLERHVKYRSVRGSAKWVYVLKRMIKLV